MNVRDVLILIVLFTASGLLLSCGGGTADDTLIYARGSDSNKLDPHDVSDGESVKVIDQIFDTLVRFPKDPTRKPEPSLAEAWSSSSNGTSWVFQLRDNVSFHDGSTLTAKDVVFSFERLMNPSEHGLNGPYSGYYSNIEKVEAVDSTTVRFKLKHPSAVFLRNLAMFSASVVSSEAVKKHGDAFGSHPSGTGPYQFVSWSRGERIVLKRFDAYWGEPAETRTLVFIPVHENAQRIQKLISGEAHIIDGIGLENIERIRSSSGTDLLKKPGMNMGYLAMNTRNSPFDRRKVRKAIAHGIDRKEILKEIYRGIGQRADTPLPPTIWGHREDLDPYRHDPEKARNLLENAEINPDQKITFLHMTNPRPYMADPPLLARKIKNDLETIGFTNIVLRQMDWKSYIQAVQNGEHDLCLLGWTTDNGDPDNFLSALFHSKNAKVGSANNVSFFRNDAYDQTVDRAKRTLDKQKRTSLYKKAQDMLHEHVPVLPLAYMPVLAAKRTNVSGYEVYSIGEVRLEHAKLIEPEQPAQDTGY